MGTSGPSDKNMLSVKPIVPVAVETHPFVSVAERVYEPAGKPLKIPVVFPVLLVPGPETIA